MKKYTAFAALLGFVYCFTGTNLLAQNAETANCTDKVFLKDGSVFVGQISAYSDDLVIMKTKTGLDLELKKSVIKKIRQNCKSAGKAPATVDYTRAAWYHHSRLGFLPGLNWRNETQVGLFLQHTSGIQLSKFLGVGLGLGVDVFEPEGPEVITYPVFAEVRGYFLSKNITPYYSLAGGWAFAGKNFWDNGFGSQSPTGWKGGWHGQVNLGYRLGEHFTIDLGVRFQRKEMDWTSAWNPGETGTNKILNRRLQLNIGLLF